MINNNLQLILLVAAWCAYFILHSALASLAVKHKIASRWPTAARAYRAAFNLQAVAFGAVLVWWTENAGGAPILVWHGIAAWVANGLAAGALILFGYSLRFYDGREFLGVTQWRTPAATVEDQERLKISPLHRYVRHPWYALGLVLLWTRDMDTARFAVAVVATLYLVIGSWLEERKLIRYHGKAYGAYRAQVPAFIPSATRHLRRDQAAQLQAQANAQARISVR